MAAGKIVSLNQMTKNGMYKNQNDFQNDITNKKQN